MTPKEQQIEAAKQAIKESGEPLSKKELEKREKALFERARKALTKTQLELTELTVRKMEVEQHLRQLNAILVANSLTIGYEAADELDAAPQPAQEKK